MGRIIKNGISYGGSSNYASSVGYDNTTSGLDATTVQDGIDKLEEIKINNEDIVDNLITDDGTKVLSAKQGKVLQDNKINIADIVDDLITADATKVLSAKQGKILNDKDYLPYTTTEPTSVNPNGLKIAYLTSEPSTKYAGWIYLITEV